MNDEATLEAFRLADSFLPIGTYAVSYGLEQFIQKGRVSDAIDLEALLSTYLRRQVCPSDLIALRTAHAGACEDDIGTVGAADRRLAAVTLSAEFRETARNSGAGCSRSSANSMTRRNSWSGTPDGSTTGRTRGITPSYWGW